MDFSEKTRKQMVSEINANPQGKIDLEIKYQQVWSTKELEQDFEVLGFLSPYVFVLRRADQTKGILLFQHRPRYYWGFKSG